MKNRVWIIIILAICFIAGVLFISKGNLQKVKNFAETILPVEISGNIESPYSLKWGADLAKVVDQNGKGIPGATVTFTKYLRRDCDGNPTEEPPTWQGTTVTTNETGEFIYPSEIWHMESDEKKLSIHAKIEVAGFLTRSDIGIGCNYGNDRGQIDLYRIGRIEGAVIDPNGRPLANVPLWFNTHTRYKYPNSSCNGCFSANIKTDEFGGFVIEKVPPGQHIIKYPGQSGGCGPEPKIEKIPFEEYAAFQMITMKDGQIQTDVFLDLRQNGAVVKGQVVDHSNHPMAGVKAILYRVSKHYYPDGSGWSSSTENLKSVTTDENGCYVLTHVPPGEYQIQAQYPYENGKNYESGDPLDIYIDGQQELTFNLVLKRQDDSLPKAEYNEKRLFAVALPEGIGPRDMMVVDPQGNGIAGANVVFDTTITVTGADNKKTRQEWAGTSLTTDERGVFTLPTVFENITEKWDCYASIKVEGYQQRRAWLRSYYHTQDCRIDILPMCEINGQLIGTDGDPAKGNISYLTQLTTYHNPGSASTGGSGYIQTTGKDGKFSFKVSEGVHILQYKVADPDKTTLHTGGFVVYAQGGKPVNDLVIDLREDTCAVQGRVLDIDGSPVKKATVRLSKKVQWGYRHFGQAATSVEFYRSEPTDRKGRYNIERIRPGVYILEAVLDVDGKNNRTSETKTIAVSDGQTIELDTRLNR